MKLRRSRIAALFLPALFACGAVSKATAEASPDPVPAKQEAEAKGYIAFSDREKIVTRAKKEGKMRALSGLNDATIKPLAHAFRKKYPFLDVEVREIEGTDTYQRFVLQMKAGTMTEWDATFIPIDFYREYLPFLKKFDILGMAQRGVIRMPPEMAHPTDRNAVSTSSVIQVVAYNRKLIADDKVPELWEDFLRPELKGKKFIVDIRPYAIASLVPAWGLERTLNFARKLAAQDPIWVRGASRLLTAMIAGEYPLFLGPNLNSVRRLQDRDKSGVLQLKIAEPVPTRVVARADGVLESAQHPHAGLLWLEFHASPEGQEIIEKTRPFKDRSSSPGPRPQG